MEKLKEYKMLPIDDLIPYMNNARTHSDEQVEKIVKSIKEFGFVNPVLIDKNNTIIAGHGRVMAARRMGIESVPTLKIDNLTPEQMRAYVIADNKLAEDAGWDMELLKTELEELAVLDFDIELTGFSFDDIDTESSQNEKDIEEVEIPDVIQTRAKTGDIWLLGGTE